jgi:anti-sigma factor RsiW
MNDSDDTLSGRDEIEALIPWYAAGALTPAEAQRVEAALAGDPELERSYRQALEELGAAVDDNLALGAPSTRAMDKLFASIDAEPRSARNLAQGLWSRVSDLFASLSPRTLAWATVAAGLIIAVQAGVIGSEFARGSKAPARYATASAPGGPVAPGVYALVQFAPKATAAQISRTLQAHGAVIVDGPTADGLYRLRLAQAPLPAEQRNALAARLQDGKVIAFAAPAE